MHALRRNRLTIALTAIITLGAIALTVGLSLGAMAGRGPTTLLEAAHADGSALDAAAIYAAANPGVVDITARSTTTEADGPFGLPRRAEQTDTGTGMVIANDGTILTADHVVAGADSVTVAFADGATRAARILGGDPATDVAVLHVDTAGLQLHRLALGALSGHRVGDPLAVIGDPFDVQRSLSTGVISGLDRTIQAPNGFSIPHALQTDAAMNPGNSGGPVLDGSGQVIGIADQIATGGSRVPISTGVGFAVPIDIAKSELRQLQAGRVPEHAYLGVGVGDAADAQGATGAIVEYVTPGGPATRAGLRRGDRIVALGDEKILGADGLIAAGDLLRPGTQTRIVVIRGGRRLSLPITVGRQPAKASSR
jgi:putative serine protease PepD